MLKNDFERWKTYYNMMLGYFPDAIEWHHPAPPFYSAYKGLLFAWDQYFEAILQLYMDFPDFYLKNAIKIFLDNQKENGLGPRSIRNGRYVYHKHWDHTQPFLCNSIIISYYAAGNLKWLNKEIYTKLKKYLDYWLFHEDKRGEGLSVWQYAGATGMDNLYERAGRHGREEFFCEGVDLNSYLVRECQAMSLIADILGYKNDSKNYQELAEKRKNAINKWLWHEDEGIFYDYHAKEHHPIKVKCVSAFAPMWAEAVTKKQADRLVKEHLLNKKEFWRPHPVPALAATENGYSTEFFPGETGCSWRAFTWAPTNYYTFQGLRRYGYNDIAKDLAYKSADMMLHGPFCEYYSSEYGIGTGRKPFYGWTGLYMFMEAEEETGADPTKITASNNAFKKISNWKKENIF